jgi:hypothetical protein
MAGSGIYERNIIARNKPEPDLNADPRHARLSG